MYTISVPINSVFNKVTRFGQRSTAAGKLETALETLEMAIGILQTSRLISTAIDAWKDMAATGKILEVFWVHFHKEHQKWQWNTGTKTAALDRSSFLAKNTLMEALQQVEEQDKSKITNHIANAVSSQQSMERELGDLLQKMDPLKQKVLAIKSSTTNGQQRHQQRDINIIHWNSCWTHGCVRGFHTIRNYFWKGLDTKICNHEKYDWRQ